MNKIQTTSNLNFVLQCKINNSSFECGGGQLCRGVRCHWNMAEDLQLMNSLTE
jgi:hypothetical protein